MNINDGDFVPTYVKIQNYILDNIQRGVYLTGDKIPSENELAQLFSVSRVTANMAIKELSIMGVVRRVKGKGTFVAEPESLPTASKVLAPNLRLKPYGSKTHTLKQTSLIEIYPELCSKFHLPEHSLVYEIIRLIYHQGKVTAMDYSYVPYDLVGNFPIHPEEITKTYMHEYLRTHTSCDLGFVKIYINTPHYPFLDISEAFPDNSDRLMFWTTDVLTKKKQLLATTITIAPEGQEDAFITFSIE